MKRYSRFLFLFSLLLLFLHGCVYEKAYLKPSYASTTDFSGAQYVSLSDFCAHHGFGYSIDGVSHIAEISHKGNTVRIMPDSNTSLVNGSVQRYSPEAVLKDGTVYIPPSFAKYLEDVFSGKPEIAYPRKYDIRRIVIDPGHGGKDPGATGRYYKLREKEVVLDIAKRLRDELNRLGNFEIILTRDKDEFISLWRRSHIANESKADLFISVHANASRSRGLKGFEVYYISKATDDSARTLAAAENEALALENDSNKEKPSYLDATLWDMMLDENRDESQELAKHILRIAKKNVYVGNKSIKSARFYILKGTQMPAVLVETGYLSNKDEESKFNDSYYRKKLAEIIAKGIVSYKEEFNRTNGFTKKTD